MEFTVTWGSDLIVVSLDLSRFPYTLTEQYGACRHQQRFWLRSTAETAHGRAVKNAEYLVDLIRDAEPQRRSRPFLGAAARLTDS